MELELLRHRLRVVGSELCMELVQVPIDAPDLLMVHDERAHVIHRRPSGG